MQEWMLIHDPAVVKALASPQRLRILDELTREEASVQQLAERLGEAHAKVFYHVKELSRHGLIEQVGDRVKNGITEKFYRAVARTFYLGQSLGRHSNVTEAAEEAVKAGLLRRRREQDLAIDYRRIARDLVGNALQIQPGARVVLEGGSHQLELLEAVALECRLVGGEALVRLTSTDFVRSIMAELPLEALRQAPPLTTFLYGNTDVWVTFDAVPAPSTFADCPPERVDAIVEGELAAYRLGPKRFAAVLVGYPTRAWADELAIDYSLLHDQFWGAFNVSTAELHAAAAELRAMLAPGRELTAAAQRGTKLMFVCDGSPIINDGSLASVPAPSPTNLTDLSLPGGQAIAHPAPGTLSGTFAAPVLVHRSGRVSGLRLTVERGVVTDYRAAEGAALLPALIGAPGEAVVSQLSFGFNPGAPTLTGYRYLDGISRSTLGLGLTRPGIDDSMAGLELWLYTPDARLTPKQ